MNFERVRQFMDHLTRTKVPGNAICIYLGGQKVFEYASGYADLETQTPMTGRELVNIYSCSKVTTVTAAAQQDARRTRIVIPLRPWDCCGTPGIPVVYRGSQCGTRAPCRFRKKTARTQCALRPIRRM